MDIFTSVKASLRISHSKQDVEIKECIETAKQEMRMSGVTEINPNDPYTATAIKTYSRYWFNYQGEAERYRELFDKQLVAMALSGRYKKEEVQDGT